ncbi:hypothetical protein FB459_3015 [Yimella lutea]|uniref:Uncharacterized protein n=1 Tax=Yimella lutea TaxID=587872 RepID=A0A542EJE6_9MICO|nr:hypothetical protein FB459_3015 [Yimella lutea]
MCLTDEKSYPKLPQGDGVVFKRNNGAGWAFRVEGAAFRIYKAPSPSAGWSQVTVQPNPPVPAGDGVQVDWVRPAQ